MSETQIIGTMVFVGMAWLIGVAMGGATEWREHRPFCSCKQCRKWMEDHA